VGKGRSRRTLRSLPPARTRRCVRVTGAYGISPARMSASVRLRAREFNYLAPLLGLVGDYLASRGCSNVSMLPPVSRAEELGIVRRLHRSRLARRGDILSLTGKRQRGVPSFLQCGGRLLTHSGCRGSIHFASQSYYSITSSAVANSVCGMVRPSALAVLAFRAVSNLTGS
jgi:hypothetical protein